MVSRSRVVAMYVILINLYMLRVSFRGEWGGAFALPFKNSCSPYKAMVYIKVFQNAPEAIYESIKCKYFLEQHSQVPECAPETI